MHDHQKALNKPARLTTIVRAQGVAVPTELHRSYPKVAESSSRISVKLGKLGVSVDKLTLFLNDPASGIKQPVSRNQYQTKHIESLIRNAIEVGDRWRKIAPTGRMSQPQNDSQ